MAMIPAGWRAVATGRAWVLAWLACWLGGLAVAQAAEVIAVEPGAGGAGIAAALARAQAGDTVRLAAGTFELPAALRPKSGVKLLGAGQDQTRLIYKGAKADVLVNITGCEDVEVAQLTLDGQNSPLVQQGISGGNARRLWLHHLTIRNLDAKTWGPHAILFTGWNPTMEGGVTDSRITDCLIEDIGLQAEYGGGIRMAWGSVRNQVLDNVIRRTGRGGIFGDHSGELVIRHNQVSGSGGEGLGIEIWGGCPKSLIEDNVVDHWISVDGGGQIAVRRNTIGADDGTVKYLGIEIIARDVVVTDNIVKRGAQIGLSVSNRAVKNNIYWGYNTVSDCLQWGAQLQGEKGGIAHHYFYRCAFEHTIRGDPKARYPGDSGHGFRTNGACRGLVLEDCTFRDNGGHGVQLGGRDVDALTFVRATITGNALDAVTWPDPGARVAFTDGKVEGNGNNKLPGTKAFAGTAPVAAMAEPNAIRAGQAVAFACRSEPAAAISERLWDFGDGIPEVAAQPTHTFRQPGAYRVTLIVWDQDGRGGRAEKMVQVLPAEVAEPATR